MNVSAKLAFTTGLAFLALAAAATAGQLTIELTNSRGVLFVGAVDRWDEDGNARVLPDQKAKIDAPHVDAKAERLDNGGQDSKTSRWGFKKLPKGKYDIVIITGDRRRVEGFFYPPVMELDPFFPSDATTDDETRDTIVDDIHKSQHYENIVEPLYLGGDKKAVRVLVMLIRDKQTTYDEVKNAATMRHEVWQYSWNYGGWQKEKRTKVLDRVLMPREEMHRWTWLWEPKLGGIEIDARPKKIRYAMPSSDDETPKGMRPKA